MKRFRITLMVPHSTEIIAGTMQEAHNEATRLVSAGVYDNGPRALVHSVEALEDLIVEEIDFDNIRPPE